MELRDTWRRKLCAVKKFFEIVEGHNHGVAVDYFAVGVIVYECMMGKRPYLGRSR